MRPQISLPINVQKTLKKLGRDIREARIRRRISTQLMADRVGTTRMTLRSIELGSSQVSIGFYATCLYVLGLLENLSVVADIANDKVGQALANDTLPKRIVTKRNFP